MIAIENVNTFVTGVYPDAVGDNSTGAATQDGFEFIAEFINNSIIGPQQAIMDYAGLTPDGVTEAAGASQMIEAIQKGNAVGPGIGVTWWKKDGPSITGDRVLLLSGQGVLISAYPDLDAAVYVGDANNAAVAAGGGSFYRSSDASGVTPDILGPYLNLPDTRGYFLRGLDVAAAVDPDGASRFLGDIQDFSVEDMDGQFESRNTSTGVSLNSNPTGVFGTAAGGVTTTATNNAATQAINVISFSASNVAQTSTETRPVDISTNLGITY